MAFRPNPKFEPALRKKLERRVTAAAQYLRKRIVQRISKSNRTAGPSAPGQPPHADTGLLRASVFATPAKSKGDRITATVGDHAEYAPHLEYGTRTMDARPFVHSTLDQERANLLAIITRPKPLK